MRFSGFANILGLLPASGMLAAVLGSFAFVTATAMVHAAPAGDDLKELIKDAAKLTRSGKLEESEDLLRRAAALDDKRSEARVELAYVLAKQRRLGDAYAIIYPIVKDEPKNARAFAVLGATLLAGGRFEDARLVFFNAIKLNRKEDLAWAGYGLLDFYENKIGDSLSNLREAVFHEPNEPDYRFALAQVSARAELYSEAAEAYKDFLSISNPADEDRRARIRGLINFLRYLGQSGSLYRSTGKDQTSVPIELVGNRPVVTLYVNGKKEPLRFVLDTGSGISVISDQTAKRLKIKPVTKGGHARGIGGDGKFEIVYGLLREVKIGDVKLRQVPVYLRKFHSDSYRVDGYIGLALISKFLTTIDYGAGTFSLTRRSDDKKEFRAENSEMSLPLRLTSSGFLSGEVQVHGLDVPLNFIVDTGASVSVISYEVANEDVIRGFLGKQRLRVIGSAGVTENVRTFMLPKVSFGQHSEQDIMAVALDLDLINEASGFEQSGILGGNFLKKYRLTFDFAHSKVTFVPVKPEND
ncbi:MAG: aspartyl protease family protein [Pyrinomonadaceae bacterium]